MENPALAKVLSQISTILELKEENPFKIRSYQKAVSNIEHLTESISDIYKKGGRKALEEIDGIGSGISERIEEILTTGKSSYLEELHEDIPKSVIGMLGVQGVGPKLVMKLYRDLGIKSVDELLSAAKKGALEKLDGVRGKKIENIIKGIENLGKMDKKHLIGKALPYAEALLHSIKEKPFLLNIC